MTLRKRQGERAGRIVRRCELSPQRLLKANFALRQSMVATLSLGWVPCHRPYVFWSLSFVIFSTRMHKSLNRCIVASRDEVHNFEVHLEHM